MIEAIYYAGQRYELPLNPMALPVILSLQDGALEGDVVPNGSLLSENAPLRTRDNFADVIGGTPNQDSVSFSTDNSNIAITKPSTGFRLSFNILNEAALPTWIKLTIVGPKATLTYKLYVYNVSK